VMVILRVGRVGIAFIGSDAAGASKGGNNANQTPHGPPAPIHPSMVIKNWSSIDPAKQAKLVEVFMNYNPDHFDDAKGKKVELKILPRKVITNNYNRIKKAEDPDFEEVEDVWGLHTNGGDKSKDHWIELAEELFEINHIKGIDYVLENGYRADIGLLEVFSHESGHWMDEIILGYDNFYAIPPSVLEDMATMRMDYIFIRKYGSTFKTENSLPHIEMWRRSYPLYKKIFWK
jgi:hypothetical protein